MFEFKSPDARPPSRFLSISAAVHGAIGIVLLTLHFAPAVRAMPQSWHVTLLAPIPRTRRAEPRPEPPKAHVATKPVVTEVAAPEPRPLPREFHMPAPTPRPAPAKVQLLAIAAVAPVETHVAIPQIEMPVIEHVAPRILKTDNFSDAKSATVVATAANLSTKPGGFGAVETASSNAPPRSLSTSGFGTASTAAPAIERRAIASAQFGDAQVAANAPASHTREAAAASSAVEILFKPRPAYTSEARRLQIEGEVLLEIQFTAAGELRILRVVHGLGHGLDESAAEAARQIRFRPALRASAPVDSTAVVHIQFQLAY